MASDVGEAGDERRLGQVALGEDRHVDALAHRGGGEVHRLPAREQRQRAAAGGGDQGHQLVVDGVAIPVGTGVREVQRAVQQRLVRVVERAADVGHVGLLRRQSDARRQRAGDRGAGQDRRALLPDALAQDRADVERGDLQPRVLGRPGHEVDVAVTVVERQVEVLDRPAR